MTAGSATKLRIVPANEVPAGDVELIFGDRGEPARCHCQWFKCTSAEWRAMPPTQRAERLREQSHFGDHDATGTTGLIAYLGAEPVGWCAVEPRRNYVRLRSSRVVWAGRQEDPDDERVWAVTCFVTRDGFRRRGVMGALTTAAVGFARDRGARAVEGYPMITEPGKEFTWGELFVGSRKVFADAGFTELTQPTKRRVVMRLDF